VTTANDTLTRLAAVVGAPAFVLPWLDRFYDDEETELALAVGDGQRTVSDLAVALGAAEDDLRPRLARAHRRYVVEVQGEHVALASFADRSAVWAQFEGWKDVPGDVRERLTEWWLADYTESVRPALTKLRDGHPDPGRDADYAYLLLHEAEELVRSQERVYLWPCDCRTLKGGCDQSIYNCIRFVNDRDLGWEISKERAVDILREADAAGLTHTDYVGLGGESDPHAICNCCTDCCQPHLAAERLGVGDIWPRRRHVARLIADDCTLCGTCVERCPFGALEITTGPGSGETLVLAASACRGCGLCATGCPEGAIAMDPRAGAAQTSAAV
jgi:ferredoxin